MNSSNRFEILQVIGKGQMGIVYKAKDRVLDRMVALKRFQMENKSTRLAIFRFLKKALQIAELNHSNIIPLYDVGEDDQGPFVSMELIDGQNLSDLARERKNLDEKEVLVLGRQVGRAIEFAHTQGVVHGALKHTNILLERRGLLKVGDFGLSRIFAKRSSQDLSTSDFFFTAPEQFMDSLNLQPRNDIFSFGKLLYYLSVGQEVEVESTLIPPRLKRLILKATEKKPQKRYEDMSTILDEIEIALKDRTQITIKEVEPYEEPLLQTSSRDLLSSSCGHLNTKTSIFCGKCGKDLKITCSLCGHEYSEFEESCPNCEKAHQTGSSSHKLSKNDWAELLKPKSSTSSLAPLAEKIPSEEGAPPLSETLQDTMKDLDEYQFTQALAKIKTALKHNRESIDHFTNDSPSHQMGESSGQEVDPIGALLISPPSPAPRETKDDSLAEEYTNMATAYLETFHFDKALNYAKKALVINPNLKKAQEIFKASSEKEKQLNIAIEKAENYEKSSNIKMAHQEWSRILELLPYHEGIRKKVESLKEKLLKLDDAAKKAVEAMTSKESYAEYVKEQGQNLPSSVKEEMARKDLAKAKSFLNDGKFKDAKLYAKKVLQFDWSNKEAQEIFKIAQEMMFMLAKLLERADYHETQKDYQRALLEWKKIQEITPSNKKVQQKIKDIQNLIKDNLDEKVAKAETLFENKEFRRVLLECQKVLKIFPGHKYCKFLIEKSKEALKAAETFLAQAKEAFEKEEWDRVVKYAQKSLDIDWKKKEAQELMKNAIKVLEKEEENTNKKHERTRLLEKAALLFEEKQFQSAIEMAQRLLDRDPSNQKALSILQESVQQEKNQREELKQKAEEEARRKAEEEARRKAEEEARRKAEEEARRKAEEEARRKAEEEARRKAEEEARRKAEEEARKDFSLSENSTDLESFLNTALFDRNEREEDNRRKNEIAAILEMTNDLLQQDQKDMALRELEKGLQRHPGCVEFEQKLRSLQEKEEPTKRKTLREKLEMVRDELKPLPTIQEEEEEDYSDSLSDIFSEEEEENIYDSPFFPVESPSQKRSTKKHVTDRKKLVAMFQELISDGDENLSHIKTPPLGEELSMELLNEIREMKKKELSKMETDMIDRKDLEAAGEEARRRAKMDTDIIIDRAQKQRAKMGTSEIKKKELIKALEESVQDEEIAGMETLSLDASEVEKLKSPPDSPSKP